MNAVVQPSFVTGWALNTATDLAGVRSLRVEQAVAEMRAFSPAGDFMASFVPVFIRGRFWVGPDTYRGWPKPDPQRFAPPSPEQLASLGFTGDQVTQLLQAQQAQCNTLYAYAQGTGQTGNDVGGYRGEPNTPGFPTYVPKPIDTFGPDGRLITVTVPPEIAGTRDANPFWLSYKMHVTDTIAGHQFWGATGPLRADHWLCDVWYDMRTDVNVARYVRSWARAYGVSIAAEPT